MEIVPVQVNSMVPELITLYQKTGRVIYKRAAEEISRLQSMVAIAHIDEAVPLMVNITTIQSVVSNHYDVTPDQMINKSNRPDLVEARRTFVYLCRHMTRITTVKLGKLYNRTHGSVAQMEAAANERKMKDEEYAKLLLCLRQKAIEITFEHAKERANGRAIYRPYQR